jgi:polysaccharide export outer membrane protein
VGLLADQPPPGGCRFEPLPEAERVRVLDDGGPYRLGIGDVVHVAVPGQEQFVAFGESSKGEIVGTRVKEDGNLYLPMLRTVPAAGRTVVEVQDDIRERMKQYATDPFVGVDVLDHRSQKFYVLGCVANPGVFPVDGRATLLDAVALAGGPTPVGDIEEAHVMRGSRVLPICLADIVVRGDPSRNVTLKHGDVVFVPCIEDRKVYVFGEVMKAGVVKMTDSDLTLAEALAEAGGINPATADDSQVRIFRGGWCAPYHFTVSVCDIYKYGEGIRLRSGDRILVATSELATWGRALGAVAPLVTIPLAAIGTAGAVKTLQE